MELRYLNDEWMFWDPETIEQFPGSLPQTPPSDSPKSRTVSPQSTQCVRGVGLLPMLLAAIAVGFATAVLCALLVLLMTS